MPCRLETQARREALAAAPCAGRQLRDLWPPRPASTPSAPGRRPGPTLETSERRAGAVLGSVRRLPDLAALRRDLIQAGRALGTAAVNALSARAVRIFTETTRLLGRAFGHAP